MYSETAFAKINLALHVRKRRDDGYHSLETVFAFVDAGDRLTIEAAQHDAVTIVGEFAARLGDPADNIVMKALALLPRERAWHVKLEKNLPVAAGLGGGSADAGALFRLAQRAGGLPPDWAARAAALGADVPACVCAQTIGGRGTGTDLFDVENDLSGTPILLINPRVPLPTGPVFRGWDGRDLGPLPTGGARAAAIYGRNDLENSAAALVPEIADMMEILRASGAFVARMSGSGASCFALYSDEAALAGAQAEIARKRPGWWRLSGRLR